VYAFALFIDIVFFQEKFDFLIFPRSFTKKVIPNFKVCKHQNKIYIGDELKKLAMPHVIEIMKNKELTTFL